MTGLGFSRRAFMGKTCAAGLSVVAGGMPRCSAAEEVDRFGGLKALRFEPTGFFRVENKKRWWFVTPDGAAFLSFGLNHPNQEYMLQPYNIEHWKQVFGFRNPTEPVFQRKFTQKVMQDLVALGMNSIGTHAKKHEFNKLNVPYVQGLYFVPTPYWMAPAPNRFSDVFAPSFERHCDRVVDRMVISRKDDPYLLGYTFTDCPVLTDLDAAARGQATWGRAQPQLPIWPRVLRNLGGDAPGKLAFMTLMRKRYSTIEEFNQAYGTKFSTFETLRDARSWSSMTRANDVDDNADNLAFLLEIMEKYYQVACAAIRKSDPHHLLFGDILNAQTPPPDAVVALIGQHTDLIAYQYYGDYAAQREILDRWSELTGKPLYHADTCFSVAYEEMPAPIGEECPSQEIRAQKFFETASKSFSRPDFVGLNWCGWMDAWAAWKTERQHSGLQDPFGRYHEPMPETMSQFGSRLYEIAQSAT